MEGLRSMGSGASPRLGWAVLGIAALLAACGPGADSRLDEVRSLQESGRFDESIGPLRAILADAPDLPEANHRLGVALVQTGQPDLAVGPLERSAGSGEFAVTSGLLLASAFLSMNAQDDAVRVASKVLEADPQRAAALRIRAQAHLGAGRKAEALADAQKLAAMLPDDAQAAVLLGSILADQGDLAEAEKIFVHVKQLGDASGDRALSARGCLALANFLDKGARDEARAKEAYEGCLAGHPTDPLTLQLAAQFYDTRREYEKATALWQSAAEAAPDNLSFRTMLAERLAATGTVEDGEAVLAEATTEIGTAAAWQVLADFQRRHGRAEAAAGSIERAAEIAGGGDDALRFAQGDLYVELGRVDDAEAIASAITEPAYRELLRGRILLVRGDPAGALEAFSAGIRRWPSNARARYLAAIAARGAGDTERAIGELREAVRVDPTASDAALLLATIYLERGEWANAVQLASLHFEKRDRASTQAFRVAIRAATGAKQYDTARSMLANLAHLKGTETLVLLERAGVERAEKGPSGSLAVLEDAKLDLTQPGHEPVLRAVAEDLLALGQVDRALARIDAAVAAHPDSGSLLELRGAALARAGRPAEARTALEQALEADPQNVRALTGLAKLAAAAGEIPQAVEILDRAAALGPADAPARYLAAQILLAAGSTEDAERRLREVVAESPANGSARNDLAWLLANRGTDLDTALSLAEQARRIQPTADVIDTLGFVQLKRGDAAAATALFEEALALRPKDPTIRYHLGLALAKAGNRERAAAALQEALDAGPFPDAEAAKQEMARLQQPEG